MHVIQWYSELIFVFYLIEIFIWDLKAISLRNIPRGFTSWSEEVQLIFICILFGREIPKFNQKAWRKYLFLENLCKDMLHIYFSTCFYIKGSKSCLKTSYKKWCIQIISYLIDSSRQGSLKCSGPKEINQKYEIKVVKGHRKECKISIHCGCSC